MRVKVVPLAELRRLLPDRSTRELWLELPESATVGDALATLNVTKLDGIIIGIDGVHAKPTQTLHDGAQITLVTPMEGGATQTH
ncbi:MAG: MoaD/ThiS family protein [Chloroflexota bacterium]